MNNHNGTLTASILTVWFVGYMTYHIVTFVTGVGLENFSAWLGAALGVR